MTSAIGTAVTPLRDRVAREVRAQMARHGLSQVRLAELLSWRQQYLSRRLTGIVPLDTNDLEALSDVFGVPPESFFSGPPIGEVRKHFFLKRRNYTAVITSPGLMN